MEESITIRKQDLWKYSTFILAAILIVGAFVFFNKGSTGNTVNAAGGTATAADLSVFIKNSDLYPSLGPVNAKNVVIEFSDFQCPYCALASGLPSWSADYMTQYSDLIGSAQKIQEKAANGEIRFIYVPMSFLGQESVYTAQAGLCANEQGKFWEMHDAIFTAHDSKENNGKYSKENLKKLAMTISGLDQNKFGDCLDKDKTLSAVREVSSEASKVTSGTPTFYVNGVQVSASWRQLSAAIA